MKLFSAFRENCFTNIELFEAKSNQPYHTFSTKDGHSISVHLKSNEKGNFAHFINHSLFDQTTKIVHWPKGAETPSKSELEKFGGEKETEEDSDREPQSKIQSEPVKAKPKYSSPSNSITIHDGESSKEIKLNEASKGQHVVNGKMTPNTVGKVTEHATMIHLINLKHEQNGTTGSQEHTNELKEHEDAISTLTKGVSDPTTVKTRMKHGETAANLILDHIKEKHGENAKIASVGHTANEGDITKFTRGIHSKDTQETNPSDVAVEVTGSKLKSKHGSHFEGYSLKSSAKAGEITAANPAIHMYGMLDTPNRKMNTEEVSRNSLRTKVHIPMGGEGKTAAQRGKEIDREREKEGIDKGTNLELKASKLGQSAIRDVTEEFHKHLTHLTENEGDNGHHLIANMLKQHLVSDSDMPWYKVKVKGETPSNVKGVLVEGSESPLKRILNDKNIKYFSNRLPGSPSVQVGFVHPKTGQRVVLASYTPKTKSNAYKSDVHGWNVKQSSAHSTEE